MYLEMLNKIKEYESIVIFGHVSPDGDCYGAQTALKEFIKEYFPNKNVYILGTGFKKFIPLFGEMDEVDEDIITTSLAILVDCSDLERVEDQRILKCKEIVKLDHHLDSDKQTYQTVNISETTAGSACQIVGQLILYNGYNLTKNISERLFLGIITDSGRFLYLSSSKGTFSLMEKIMETNVDFQKIYDVLYETDECFQRAKGYISYAFKTKGNVAYIILDKEKLRELKIDYNQASTMVNCLSGMKDYPIWVTFAEHETGLIRVELRSKIYNVQQVAIMFGGGGHLQASGCRLTSIDECYNVVDELVKLGDK